MSRRQGPDGDQVDAGQPRRTSFVYDAPTSGPAEDAFNWGNVDSVYLQRAIDAVTSRGHSISFAKNYRQTAGTITILAGNDRPKWTDLTEAAAEDVLKKITG